MNLAHFLDSYQKSHFPRILLKIEINYGVLNYNTLL